MSRYESKERRTELRLTLVTYGTEEQMMKSINKMKDELELQGFTVEFHD